MQQRSLLRSTVLISLTLLPAACSWSEMKESYTGEREVIPVNGPRRPPALNPAVGNMPAPSSAPVGSAPTPPATPVASGNVSDFDRYDMQGNEIISPDQTTASVPAANPAPVATPAASEPRKAFVDNPAPAAQVIEMPATQDAPKAAPVSTISAPPPAANAAAAPASTTEAAPAGEKRSWLERTGSFIFAPFDSLAHPDESEKGEEKPESSADKSYPPLSSVPQKPAEFSVIKSQNTQAMEELKTQHEVAQEEKQALYAEPTGDEASAAVEMANTAPPAQPAPQQADAAPAIVTHSTESPVLLGHAQAPVEMQEQASQPAPAQAVAAPAPVVANKTDAEPVAQEPEKPGMMSGFWQRIKSQGEQDNTPPPAAPVATAPSTETQEQPQEMVTRETEPARETPPALQPQTDPHVLMAPQEAQPQALPALAPAAAPTDTIAASDTTVQDDAPAARPVSTVNLPSPQILQEVKVLPPSRYGARARTLQHNAQ